MNNYRQPFIFDDERGVFLKVPLGGFCTLLDEDFDNLGGDAFIDRIGGEIAACGTYARGIDVLPSFNNGSIFPIAESTISQKAKRSSKETKAAIAQRKWQEQRAAEKEKMDAALAADWDRIALKILKARYGGIKPRPVPDPASGKVAYRIFNSEGEHISSVFWDHGKFRLPSGRRVERDELGFIAAKENVTFFK